MVIFLSSKSQRPDAPGTTARWRHTFHIAGNRSTEVAQARVGRRRGGHDRNVVGQIIGDNA